LLCEEQCGYALFGDDDMRHTAATTLAGLLLAASSTSVFARPATAMFNANLRSGPGVENPVVAIIPDQAAIGVGRCAGSWCRVSWNGVDGYLSTTLIPSASARRSRVIEDEPPDGPMVFYGDRSAVVAPNCDPSVDAACAGGYNNAYGYNGGYYGDYAYINNGYDNYVYGNPGFYGGYYGGGYTSPRLGGGRLGGGRLGGSHDPGTAQASGRSPRGAAVIRASAAGSPGRGINAGHFSGGGGKGGEPHY
jgi:uncharacterized protein YraI